MNTAQPAQHAENQPSAAGDEDFSAAAPSTLVRACSGVLMLAGLLTALAGLQLLFSRIIDVEVLVMKWALMVLGVAAIAIGWQASRARMWAAVSGLGLGVFLTLVNLGWLVFGFTHGMVSLMAMVSVPAAIGGAVAMVFTLAPVRRATEARRRLRAQGLDVGI